MYVHNKCYVSFVMLPLFWGNMTIAHKNVWHMGLTMNSLQSNTSSIKSLAWRQRMNCLFCCGPDLSPFSVARVPVVVSAAPSSCSVWWLRQPAMTDPLKTPPPTHSLCPPKTLTLNPKYQKYASSIERPVCAYTGTAYVKISSICVYTIYKLSINCFLQLSFSS